MNLGCHSFGCRGARREAFRTSLPTVHVGAIRYWQTARKKRRRGDVVAPVKRFGVADVLVPIQQIATFATDPFRGNPAYVVTLATPVPAPVLHALCRHLNEPVIAVLSRDIDALTLRFITPTGLHAGPGHVTHAAAWVALKGLAEGRDNLDLRLDTGGHRSVRAEGDLIAVDWPVMPYAGADFAAPLEEALGARPRETFTASFGAIAIFDTEEIVADLKPDLDRLARLACDTVMATSPSNDADFAIRVFAPRLGLPEDPVCGTAHRILVPLWAARLGRDRLVSHQLSPRGGELFCRFAGEIVTIAGHATPFMTGSVALPV
jgi:PhzF family phenazine biosynthesis protein